MFQGAESIAPAAGDVEKLLEVIALPVVNDVEQRVRVEVLLEEFDRGQIGGGVSEGASLLRTMKGASIPSMKTQTAPLLSAASPRAWSSATTPESIC